MRPLFQNILCPVDFSEHSKHALRYAALLACRTDARLTAIYVEDPLLAAATKGMNVAATTQVELQRFVERATAPFGATLGRITFYAAVGQPHREIQRAAARFGCDLIVMGAHGITGVSKMMLGSTTERVLRAATVPVLAIPPFKGRPSVPRGWLDKSALVPVELGPHLRTDVATAAEVANRLGTVFVLLHVVPPRDRRRLLKARTTLETLGKKLKSEALVACHVVAGKPGEQIAAMAADADVDLVMLTRRAGKGLFGARLGSISYQVLCEAGTPVLALPSNSKWLRRAAHAPVNGSRRAV